MAASGESKKSPIIPDKVLDILNGYYATQCLLTACELEIFDHLADSPQSTAKDLTQRLSTNEEATVKLLDVLVSLDLLKAQQSDRGLFVYSNNQLAECLTKTSPSGFLQRVLHFHIIGRPLFQSLTSAIQEGTNRWTRVFNMSQDKIFDNLYNNKDNLKSFLKLMSGYAKPGAHAFVTCFDLSRFKNVCDLGGCTGDIAYAACSAYPNMKITVLDIPQVTACSSHFAPSVDDCPNKHNVSFVAGDFFEPILPTADLYVLTHIIHDWGQDKIDVLLSNVFKNLPSGGGILIGESVLKDDRSGPLHAQYKSLLMLVLCEQGATERSWSEYQQLLEKHGFKDVQIRMTNNNVFDAMLAIKP